jgi:YD repeat-containing protein
VSCADPIDVVTGEVLLWKTDFVLPGTLPVELKRSYASALPHSSCFGPHWASTWGQYVEAAEGKAIYYAGDGRRITFELPASGPSEWVANPTVNKLRLRRASAGFEVRDEQNRTVRFSSEAGGHWLLSAIQDANGNSIQFTYDGAGALREVSHSGGYRLQVEGTAAQIRRVTLDGAELVRYEYSPVGMLAAVTDGSGLPFRYSYDEQGRATRWEDRKGTWYEYRLDERGRCVETRGPLGLYRYLIQYDEASRTTLAIDSQEHMTTYIHDGRQHVVERRDARGGVTRTEWDERGNKLKESDPAGRGTERTYDDDGNLTGVQDGLGRKTAIEYNTAGVPVKLVDASGKEWTRSYDARGNLTEARGPDGTAWRYERDAAGNLVRLVDPEGRSRNFGYDGRGLLVWATDWKGGRTELKRDAQGRVTERVDALGRRTRFAYDKLGKLGGAELADGARLRWEYDAEGNLARRIGADGKAYEYRYGAFDLLTEVRKPAGGRLQLRYDTEARLRCVENELGQKWWYEYNETGQVVREADFHGRVQRYEYDGSGLCVKRVNGAGEEIALERDAAGQLVAKRCSDGSVSEFAYDALGRVVRAVADGVEVVFDRDAYGRVVRESQGARELKSEYDARGLRVRRQTDNYEAEWEWDANGQVSALRAGSGALLEFARDAAGRETERKMRGGVALRQEYDALDRLKSQWAGTEAALIEREYEDDVNGDPVEIRDARWGKSEFEYNDDGRIAGARKERGKSESFEYNAVGDIAKRVLEYAGGGFGQRNREYGEDGRLARAGQTEYQWDADWRLGHHTRASCQPDVTATPKFRAWNRHSRTQRRSQLRGVQFAPQQPVAVTRQAHPQTVLLRKVSHQFLQFGKREGDRDPAILRWHTRDALHDERILAVLTK